MMNNKIINLKPILTKELEDSRKPIIYMVRPKHFKVFYDINPWMTNFVESKNNQTLVNNALAQRQWKNLVDIISEAGANVRILNCGTEDLPDITFVANAGSFLPSIDDLGNLYYKLMISKFNHIERKPEENLYEKTFQLEDASTSFSSPFIKSFEGDGDLLRLRDILVLGYGHRTHEMFRDYIQFLYGMNDVLSLKLINPSFYHLDTCFFYHGVKDKNNKFKEVCWFYPSAFDSLSISNLRAKLILKNIPFFELCKEEAEQFSCNAVGVNETIIANSFSERHKEFIKLTGFNFKEVDLSEFHKAGGSAKCLTLRAPSGSVW